jgi:hypothetical protein
MKHLSVFLFSALFSVSGLAQSNGQQAAPGYVDFGDLEAIYGEPRVMVNLEGTLLKLLSAAASAEDPEAAALMRDLEGVRINVYDTGGETAPAMERLEQTKGLLEKQQWQAIMQVYEADEQVHMYTKMQGDVVQGMAIMAVDAQEAVFLNILGSIDPARVGKILDQLDVDVSVEEP